MPPGSIKKFETFYLVAWVIIVISTFLAWDSATILQSQLGRKMGLGGYGSIMAVGLLIPPGLCYLASRKRSNVARWIIVALFAMQGATVLLLLFRGAFTPGAVGGLGLLSFSLRAIAVRLLFGSEAKEWFAKTGNTETPTLSPPG